MSSALGLSGSGSKGKSKGVVIPFSENELELQGINLDIARSQLQSLFQQQALQEELGKVFRDQLGQQAGLLEGAGAVSQASLDRLLDITSGGGISPEQAALLDQIEQNTIASIRQGTQENLGLLKQELAPELGLRASDSPILDRGALVAREGLRQEQGARSQRAAAELSLPQQEAQFLSSLQNQDFLQRLNFGQQAAAGGLGLASVGTQVGAQEFRPNVTTKSKESSFGFGVNNAASL